MSHRTIRSAAALAVIALGAMAAHAQEDAFTNGPLSDLAGSNGGFGWTSAWTKVGTDVTNVSGPGLSYPWLEVTPAAAVTPAADGATPNSIYQRTFSYPSDWHSVFIAFLLREDTALDTWGGLSFGTGPYKIVAGLPDGAGTFGLAQSNGTVSLSFTPRKLGKTTLLVVKISKNTTPPFGITYRLFVNPQVGSFEPGYANASITVSQVADLPTALSIDNGTGFTTDEIRISNGFVHALPPDPTWTNLGYSHAGSNGVPVLVGTGELSTHSLNQLDLTHDLGDATALLVLGATAVNQPLKGGVLVPQMESVIPLQTSAEGVASLPFIWPDAPAGTTFYLQVWTHDEHAVLGFSASNGMRCVSSP